MNTMDSTSVSRPVAPRTFAAVRLAGTIGGASMAVLMTGGEPAFARVCWAVLAALVGCLAAHMCAVAGFVFYVIVFPPAPPAPPTPADRVDIMLAGHQLPEELRGVVIHGVDIAALDAEVVTSTAALTRPKRLPVAAAELNRAQALAWKVRAITPPDLRGDANAQYWFSLERIAELPLSR